MGMLLIKSVIQYGCGHLPLYHKAKTETFVYNEHGKLYYISRNSEKGGRRAGGGIELAPKVVHREFSLAMLYFECLNNL